MCVYIYIATIYGEKFSGSRGGVRNLERRNVERPIFRNLKIANIKATIIFFSN